LTIGKTIENNKTTGLMLLNWENNSRNFLSLYQSVSDRFIRALFWTSHVWVLLWI